MKHIILLLLFFLVSNLLIGQSYIPFVKEGKKSESSWINSSTGCSTCQGGDRITIGGDTVINGLTYNKIWSQQVISSLPIMVPPFTLTPIVGSPGLIREDTTEQKVYLYNENGQDQLVYDFGMQVGHVLVNSMGDDSIYLAEIQLVTDTSYFGSLYPSLHQLCSDKPRRLYLFNHHDTLAHPEPIYFILEGIGGSTGWFNEFYIPFEHHLYLSCVNDGTGECLYGGCYTITNTTNVLDNEAIKLYPNPVNDILTIEVPNIMNDGHYTLSSIDGRVIQSTNIINLKEEITLEYLENGMYFLHFYKKNELVNSQKIVVQH